MQLVMPQEDYVKLGYWKNRNLYTYLEEHAARDGNKVALVDKQHRYTYAELNLLVRKMAGAFKKQGIKEGDVVSFQLPNWAEVVVISNALQMIGAIGNPIMPIYRRKEIEYILNVSNSKILIIPHMFRKFNYLEMIRELKSELKNLQQVVVIDRYQENPSLEYDREMLYSSFLESGDLNDEVVSVNEQTIALLIFTSGTTSQPKGVLHSHNTLNTIADRYRSTYELTRDDVIFMPAPIGHVTGFAMGTVTPLLEGCKVIFQDIWNPNEAVETILNEEVTWSVGAPPFVKGVTSIVEQLEPEERKRLKLKCYASGGADIQPDLILKAREVLKCYVGRLYGSSESGTPTFTMISDPAEKAACTDGRPLPSTQMKLLDDDGREVSQGQMGEIATKSPDRFLGYLQSEFNKDAFTADGFFLTGDVGVLDQEGYLTIRGRKKDIIIRGGENISVKEVEDILHKHPGISEIAIVGMPDEAMGEKACAYVVLTEGQSLTFEEMIGYLEEHDIAKQKFPERLEIVKQMPLNANGKIQKFKLKEDIKIKIQNEQFEKAEKH